MSAYNGGSVDWKLEEALDWVYLMLQAVSTFHAYS
jgi:hypothetical protein